MIMHEIITILGEAREIHTKWLEYGHILVDSINADNIEEPENSYDCVFSQRLKNDGAAFSDLKWYKELQKCHEDLHKAYSNLYYESHRMYNPKTLDELMELFVSLETLSKVFSEKLDEIEDIFENMSEEEYKETINKHNVLRPEKDERVIDLDIGDESDNDISLVVDKSSKKDADEEASDLLKMESINIESLEVDEIEIINFEAEPLAEDKVENELDLESETFKEYIVDNHMDADKIELIEEQTLESTPEILEQMSQKKNNIPVAKLEQHIKLKEQDIAQLKEEKELSQLELSHLEDRQKLTQKSVDQFDQYYALKQEEIMSEKHDNEELLQFKKNDCQQAQEKIETLEQQQAEFKAEIEELKELNEKDEIALQEDQKSLKIKKQFDGLKKNKMVELDNLSAHLDNRELELKKLREQVSLLEEDVEEIKQDIAKKEHDLEDISAKEKLKNEERQLQLDEQDKITQARLGVINEKQEALDALREQTKAKQGELEVFEFQIKDLNKNSAIQAGTNDDDLSSLNQQQDEKRHKLTEINKLQAEKQEEINEIESRIQDAENALSTLQTSAADVESDKEDLAVAD